MISANENVIEMLNSPRRQIGGRVLIKQGSTETVINHTDNLKKFVVDRVGENGKFFGYGVTHKATIELLDINRDFYVDADTVLELSYIIDGEEVSTYPPFYVEPTETKRDEKTNTLTIVAYDILHTATAHTFAEVGRSDYDTLWDIAYFCGDLLRAYDTALDCPYNMVFDEVLGETVNAEGTETIREILDDIAEATQSIYYVDNTNTIRFKACATEVVSTIDKSKYFEMTMGAPVMLTAITHTNELGDSVTFGTPENGVIQVIKDNAFLSLREDMVDILNEAISEYTDMDLYPINCSWRGNPLLEVADWVYIEQKDGTMPTVPLINETHTYNGGLSAKCSWEYTQTKAEPSNPVTLGEAIKETYAKVDKANKQIDLVVSEVSGYSEAISTITQTADSIVERVSAVEEQNTANNEEIQTLKNQVELSITPEKLAIEIQKERESGANKVVTNTGFTFDENGLTVEKADSEIKTQITEDGMKVFKEEEEVLTANNQGVKATDLHAVTFLIIGNNSRFEDYGNRTGCFWIGGQS